MPITLNKFKCTNGHEFEANAKLRTRCPECGVSTKRSFSEAVSAIVVPDIPIPIKPVKPEPKPIHKTSGPVLVRQGRPRMAAKKSVAKPAKPPIRKPALIGSKVSAGLVKSTTIKTRGVMPSIKRKPRKTAPARGSVAGHENVKPYWHDVADKYGF